jgi:hypothetical protein
VGHRPYRGLETLCRTTLVVRQSLIRKVTRASALEGNIGSTTIGGPAEVLNRVVVPRTMLYNLRHTKKKGDERETLSRIRRATRPKALLILRIRGEIRPRDRKRGQTWPGDRKEKAEPSFKVYTPCHSL